MNAYDKWLQAPYATERPDTETLVLAARTEIKIVAGLDVVAAADLYGATWGFEKTEQAAAIVRAVLTKDAAALLAVMTALIDGAINRCADLEVNV